MIDRPMDTMEHPDEGLIHAWLDDALDAAEAERIAAHVRSCAECQGRVAEARGLIAGASRIVGALDDLPAGTRPGWAQSAVGSGSVESGAAPAATSAAAGGGSLWRWLRVTPGRAAVAATLLVAIGITLTYQRTAVDSAPQQMVSAVFDPQKADAPATTSPEGAASEAAKPRDALLDSAMAKNVTIAQGRRTMEAARGLAVPAAPPPSLTPAPQAGAGEAVALGRAAEQARREASSVAPDRARADVVGQIATAAPAAAPTADQGFSTRAPGISAERAAPTQGQNAGSGAVMAKRTNDAVAKTCILVDSPEVGARWADQPFPLVIALDPGVAEGPRQGSVLTPAGEPTSLRAVWNERGGDSVSVTLRRIGYSGTMVLGPTAGGRTGIAVSAAAPVTLNETAVTGASGASTDAQKAESRQSAPAAAPAAQARTRAAGPPVRQLRVTARSIACPAR
jgi:hypothetical protein